MSAGATSVEAVVEMFGSDVFNEAVMRDRLPKNVFKAMMKTIREGANLDPTVADVVASAMKDWAVEKGATHYCHWFQPMTGATAEKHDSFISPTSDGRTIMEFSGKELIQGEPDASSFPSGGLRATFEARGYTAWDCTSPVFVKSDGENVTMFIPTAFCSYTGEALDKKTPLLRSMEALNKQALRVLKALGNDTSKRVLATLGSEQEYFLIDESFARERMDLVLTGRTLFGAPSPKGQEMDDQYFGTLHNRIGSYMADLNKELWRLGISAKTQHNEVSPAQYELAPIFSSVNQATDWNQLTMEIMKTVAERHGFLCSLHEKPFAGVNGSGKHNNWSMSTDDGINLLEPGNTPHENEVFLVFLMSVIRAVDKFSGLLRATVASAGNDHRLGANEAPPAILSVFLGDQLTDIVQQLAKGGAKTSKKGGQIKLGVSSLPPLPKDSTDRNRTSPFAFTGNKFEFRMPGSNSSTSGPNFVLNTIVADVLQEVATTLEKARDVNGAAQKLICGWAKEHQRILFNGDNYSEAWEKEADKRGLPNLKNTVASLDSIMSRENVAVLKKHKVLSKGELQARVEILYEYYVNCITIEGRATRDIASRQILPAALQHVESVANTVASVENAGGSCKAAMAALKSATALVDDLSEGIEKLEAAIEKADKSASAAKHAAACRDLIIPAMAAVREAADGLEAIVDAELWPLPTYAEMLYLR